MATKSNGSDGEDDSQRYEVPAHGGDPSAGSVGTGCIHLYENDTGPDDANHAEEGIFIWRSPGVNPGGPNPYSIYDIAPTALKYFNIDIPDEMIGEPII